MAPPEGLTDEQRQRIQRDMNAGEHLQRRMENPHSHKARFLTKCAKEHMDSLKCIERNYQDRTPCEPFFEAYKACRREENELRMQENEKKSARGWFW